MKLQKTVLLGMSGGVDSSVAALLLQKQGYKVIGAFLKVYSENKNKLTGECSYIDDYKMAQKIASILKIKLIFLDFEKQYKESVLNPMFNSYSRNLTPNPDIACNKIIKFPLLWEEARKLKCDYIATGHYAQIKKTKSGFHLLSGKDKTKDQSYFLAELTQKDLQNTLFPLGALKKEKVRQIAKEHKFPNWERHGTTGICFVGQVAMHDFLKQRIKEKAGNVLSPNNEVIGTHKGSSYYTIGQKIGPHIGIEVNKPKGTETKRWYVAEKHGNTIIAAPEGHPLLSKKQIALIKFHLINPKEKIPPSLKARIRHLGQLHPGKLTKKNNKYHFVFNKPVEAIAEGQYLVLYHKNRVVGSGEIRIN